ncbi:MAG: hypothetical protein WA948_12970 [Pontixanthobacter sp.]
MDTLRGNFGSNGLDGADYDGDPFDYDAAIGDEEEDAPREGPPAAIGTDERRMQVRAYNHWASQLDDRPLPSIEDLEPEDLPDFGPFSVLLDFTSGIENPGIQYLGPELASECGTDDEIAQLSDVPSRSLLSRITDHYMQIIANQAPIGFEAEFVNQRGATILYRGILLPYSSDGDTIDFIYGVINWKEVADSQTTDELLLEIDQAMGSPSGPQVGDRDGEPIEDWADGPGMADDDVPTGHEAEPDGAAPPEVEDMDLSAFPAPQFGSATSEGRANTHDDHADANPAFDDPADDGSDQAHPNDTDMDNATIARLSALIQPRMTAGDDLRDDEDDKRDDWSDRIGEDMDSILPPGAHDSTAGVDDGSGTDIVLHHDPDAGLHDCLAEARDLADKARSSEDRTRHALYAAVGRAYDVCLAAAEAPEDFAELIDENGLTVQERAPMTPVVKLVFGADYDKTRLTEYAAVLSHAQRIGIARGALSGFLVEAEGGLKGVVQAERRLRKEEAGDTQVSRDTIKPELAAKLRALDTQPLSDIDSDGPEFAMVMIHRMADGTIVMLGEIGEDIPMIEKAARAILSR